MFANLEINDCVNQINQIDSLLAKANSIRNEVTSYQSKKAALVSKLNEAEDALSTLSSSNTLLKDAETELETIIVETLSLSDERSTLLSDRKFIETAVMLLKDGGIKTKIIKQYLPVINTLVNRYLQVLDFFVHFDLDESFQESIRSRHRDDFTYESFSEGEKQRIDLSLLFTWRQVAKMKNSVATNLLILDETFDSSLDADGVDNLTKILDTLDDDTNVFIISHKGELLDGKFESKIEFVKRKNFSQVA